MSKDEPIVPYLTRLTQVQDELGGMGVVVSDHDLVSFVWKGFQDVVNRRENFPNWKDFGLTAYRKRSEWEP